MTEQEIIEYLKGNKNQGRILAFMPDEVKAWCEEHRKELLVWQSHRWCKVDAVDICTADAVTLYDDYEVKEKSNGEWIECEINKNECFFINGHYYHWSEWNTCLTQNHDWLKAFGGWQYKEEPSLWALSPMVGKDDSVQNFYGADLTVKPIIPVKIRFWKEKLK